MSMKFVSSLRDPVYGMVPVTSLEQEILKLPIMNRLKDIKQLGLAYLAFAGANHTRFEHSIGTMHVASIMATAIGLDEQETETVRLAALLHDVGHPPFSHSIEFACKLFGISEIPDHKMVTGKRIIEDKALHDIIDKRPLIHLNDIADLAVGKFRTLYFRQIVDGAIDADKIDYILRDNYHCGFPVALDINTISEILSRDDQRGIVIKPEGQSFAEQLFIGRYHLVSRIHHNLKNRLGNYLLALTLNEAWSHTTEKNAVATKMTEEWTDGDLMAYLQKEAPKMYGTLRNHLLGTEIFHEVCNFGFSNLTPLARYSAAIVSSNPSYLPRISDAFNQWVKDKQFFVDAYMASPPEPSLTIGTDPPLYLVDTPLSKAALDASLKDLHVAVYSLSDIKEQDLDQARLIDRYCKELDSTLTGEKSESLIKTWWNNDKRTFLIHKLTELVLNSETISLRNSKDFTSDLTLIVAYSVYQSFVNVFKQVVFLQSLSGLAKILRNLQDKGYFKRSDGSDMPVYDVVVEESGIKFPPEFLVDIEILETFGLMYRLIRTAKFGEQFQQKYQLRISGWGRAYYQRNLSNVQELLSLFKRLTDYFTNLIKEHEEEYNALFKKVREEPTSKEITQEAKKLSRKLPIAVIT